MFPYRHDSACLKIFFLYGKKNVKLILKHILTHMSCAQLLSMERSDNRILILMSVVICQSFKNTRQRDFFLYMFTDKSVV